MRILKVHFPIWLLFLSLVFAAFGRVLLTPLWNELDRVIISEAAIMARDPWTMFQHIRIIFSQPVLLLSFLGKYLVFGTNGPAYLIANLVIHSMNAFMVYLLVNLLFHRTNIALQAGILVALCVGNYGKILMTVAYLELILLTFLHLLILYFLIRNDFKQNGNLRAPCFILGLLVLLIAGLTRASAFSLLGCLLAYKFFFYKEGGWRAIFSRNLVVLLVVGLLFFAGRSVWVHRSGMEHDTDAVYYSWISFKNIFRYVNLMLFPMQTSSMLDSANPLVQLVYDLRTPIRLATSLTVLSFSFFGFVFGNKALRFFLAWSYISLAPFTYVTNTGDWLNLQHLYLTSFGFAVILAVVAHSLSRLLRRHRVRRWVPYLLPAFYVALSLSLAHLMNEQNLRKDPIDLSDIPAAEVSGISPDDTYLYFSD